MTGRRSALPGPMIDVIRDGVSAVALRHGHDRAVHGALVQTGMSAMQRKIPQSEWMFEVLRAGSRLGVQARLDGGRRERSQAEVHRLLLNAWEVAVAAVVARPTITKADIDKTIGQVAQVVADLDQPLDHDERTLLGHAVDVARQIGTTRPALPRAAGMAATGLTERRWRDAMSRLERAGFLVLEVPGRPAAGGSAARRRANLYRLAAPTHPEHRPMGRPIAKTYGTRASPEPAKTYGTSETVLTLTVAASGAAALQQALTDLAAATGIAVLVQEGATA
jgi:hypothetical protein